MANQKHTATRRRTPYEFGGLTFPTQESVRAFLRVDLNAGTVRPEAAGVLTDLLEQHPDADAKIGPGIDAFYVDRDGYRGRCFWVRRADGTAIDFSIEQCLHARSRLHDVSAAARTAVRDQIVAFKRAALKQHPVCAVTGQPVTWWTSHVDHELPYLFRCLLLAWMGTEPRDDLAVICDGPTTRRFRDPGTAQDWAAFHRQHAHLRLVHWRVNLSALRILERAVPVTEA